VGGSCTRFLSVQEVERKASFAKFEKEEIAEIAEIAPLV
jgi:hypothetical protein